MDSRAYVCKCINGKFAFIARNGTDMKDSETYSRIIETWTLPDSRKINIRECLYSKARAKKFIDDFDGSTMHGPDLFCVEINGKMKINLWQPMHMPHIVELVVYDDNKKKMKSFLIEAVPVEPELPGLLRKHMIQIMKTAYGEFPVPNAEDVKGLCLYIYDNDENRPIE